MRKVLLLSLNDLRQTFSDRGLMLLMFAAPIAIATIIAVTFGGVTRESSPIESIGVALVVMDRSSTLMDFGGAFSEALEAVSLPTGATAATVTDAIDSIRESRADVSDDSDGVSGVFSSIHAVRTDDRAAAEEWLKNGVISAVVIIPEDFSQRLLSISGDSSTTVSLLTRPDRAISGGIVYGVTKSLIDGFSGGVVVTQSTVIAVAEVEDLSPLSILGRENYQSLLLEIQEPSQRLISVDSKARSGGGIGFNPLVAFGATQAIFFALFTANGNATSVLEEERDGTFVRLLTTATPKAVLLAGKIVSTFVMVVVQLLFLMIALTIVGSILEGDLTLIWGNRIGRIALVLCATSFSAAGIGAIVASIAKSPEQSGVIGMVINMFMAVTGGAFGFRFDSPIRYASLVFWGSNAFEELAGGGTDIANNALVMMIFGAVSFVAALLIFQRRFTR